MCASERLSLTAFPLAVVAVLPAQAQTAGTEAKLPETVVTASRIEQRVQDALPATTLITRADIERAQTADLPTLLRQVTGIEITQNGGSGTVSSAFIRGAESRHTLVLIDGVPVNNLNFSTAALEHLPLSNVERVEIVRGNVSSLYGSAALGGVIQIFTREAGDQPFAAATLQAGSRGFVQAQIGGGMKTSSGTRLSFTAENLNDNGFNATNQSKLPLTNPDTDGYSRRAMSVGVSQDIAIGKIGLTVREATGVAAYDSQYGPATQADESKFTEQGAALTGQFRLATNLVLDAALTNTADRLRADVTAYPYFINSFSDAVTTGLRWNFAKGQTMTAGIESTRQRLESDTVYNATSRQLDSARLGYQGEVERHQVQLNVRQDKYSDFGTASTWFAGYGFRFAQNWRVNGSSSTGFNAPTFNDLYYPYGGNPNLRPEQVSSSELGLQYATEVHDARAVWFSNRFTDLIGNDASYNRVNINQARNDGLELSYRGKYGATNVRAGMTLQNPVDLATSKRLARRADTLANVGITRDVGRWSYGANLRYVGERPDGANTLAAYSVLDLTVSHAVNREVKLFGRIENLLDARYETVYGYNQPGFGVFVGLTWQPNV
jgi:vitamin B12 transporter